VLNLTSPPTIRLRVGKPIELTYDDVDGDTKRIMAAIVDLLPDEARVHRIPTEHELELTYPSGRIPDDVDEAEAASHESERRPGTD
jgi:putative phosphoserine phosphatase/1-acylglycerol-3-phosphate O-acyltransferase